MYQYFCIEFQPVSGRCLQPAVCVTCTAAGLKHMQSTALVHPKVVNKEDGRGGGVGGSWDADDMI